MPGANLIVCPKDLSIRLSTEKYYEKLGYFECVNTHLINPLIDLDINIKITILFRMAGTAAPSAQPQHATAPTYLLIHITLRLISVKTILCMCENIDPAQKGQARLKNNPYCVMHFGGKWSRVL